VTLILNELGVQTADIMVDIDDVYAPWFHTVDQECVRLWGESPKGPCDNWHMWEHYERTQREWTAAVIGAVATGLYTSVDPIPGSVEGGNRLLWFGHRLHFVTARGFMANAKNIRRWTPEWLDSIGAGRTTLTFAKDKVAAQAELGVTFDYAIDDGGHNYDALADAGVNVWLCEAPHNKNHRASQRIGSMWDFSTMVLEETVPQHLLLEPTG
jgi:hypothetical protein